MGPKQLTLFDTSGIGFTPESRETNFSRWSYSRRVVLEQCARKYYYQYYGSLLKKSNNNPQKEKLNFLKKLQSRYIRSGDILHFIIRWYLKKRQEEEHLSLDWLLEWALDVYHKDIRYSQQYEHGTPLPNGKFPPTLLLEFYYDQPDAESLCDETEERLIIALTNFMKSQNFVQFREGGTDSSSFVEKSANMKSDYFTISGKVDLIYREGDKLIIVDWKMGGSSSSDDNLQMLAYALWAKQNIEGSSNSIRLYLAHLANDTVSTFGVDEKKLKRVEARILQDLDRMQEADKFGKRGLVEAFTPCAQQKICNLCQFQEICPKE